MKAKPKRRGNPTWKKGRGGNPSGKSKAELAGLTLDELIKSDKFTPPGKILKGLQKAAATGNIRALEILTQYKAGRPPKDPPVPELPPGDQLQDLNALSADELKVLEILMLKMAHDSEALAEREKDRLQHRSWPGPEYGWWSYFAWPLTDLPAPEPNEIHKRIREQEESTERMVTTQ